MTDEKPTWAVVELMGHVRTAGLLTEEERFGTKLGRIDVPQPDGSFVTQMFGGASVYRITFCSEEAARLVAKQADARPVHAWEMPRQLSSPSGFDDDRLRQRERDVEYEDDFDGAEREGILEGDSR